MECSTEGCTNKARYKEDYLCHKHNRQKKYGFSQTKTCGTCGEEKDWKRFVMGRDPHIPAECRDCYRARILPPVEPKKQDYDLSSILATLMDKD